MNNFIVSDAVITRQVLGMFDNHKYFNVIQIITIKSQL